MIFIHDSHLRSHGNLRSSNCLVNSRWTLLVSDYWLPEVRGSVDEDDNEYAYFRSKYTCT
jgi:hypothetical protein